MILNWRNCENGSIDSMMKNCKGSYIVCVLYSYTVAWRMVHSNKNDKLSTKFASPPLMLLSFSASATSCYILLWAVFNNFFSSSAIKYTYISFCCFALAAITNSRAPQNSVQFFLRSSFSIEKYSICYFQQW